MNKHPSIDVLKSELIDLRQLAESSAEDVKPNHLASTRLEYEFPVIHQQLFESDFDGLVKDAANWHGLHLIGAVEGAWVPYFMCIHVAAILDSLYQYANQGFVGWYRDDLVDDVIRAICGNVVTMKNISIPEKSKRFSRLIERFIVLVTDEFSLIRLSEKELQTLSLVFGDWAGLDDLQR